MVGDGERVALMNTEVEKLKHIPAMAEIIRNGGREMLEKAIFLFKATDQETILIPMEMEMLTPFLEMAANISNGSYRVMETINVLAIEPPVGTYLEENGLIPSKLSNPHQMAMVSSFKI